MNPYLMTAVLTFGLLLSSCAKRPERPIAGGYLTYGIYHAVSESDSSVTFSLSLGQNGSYSKKRSKDGCLLSETGGKWNADHEGLEFQMHQLRHRPDCDSPWEERNDNRVSRRFIRGMTATSFELLDDGEGYFDTEWLTFRKKIH